MKKLIVISSFTLFFLSGLIYSVNVKNLKFEIFFKESDSDSNYIFTHPYQFAVDKNLSLYIVDYKDCIVRKYDNKGKFVFSCGKRGVGPGELNGIERIIITNDYLLIIGFNMINFYDNEGKLVQSSRHNIKNAYDLLYDQLSDVYISYRIDEKTKRFLLSLRKIDDTLISEVASYPATDRVIEGLGRPMPCYLFEKIAFGINSKKDVIYAFSEKFEVFSSSGAKLNLIIKEKVSPVIIPEDIRKNINGEIAEGVVNGVIKRISCTPPEYYSMIQDLMIDEKDNIWIKALTSEFNGFIKYSQEGKMLGKYQINNEYNYDHYDWFIIGGYLYHRIYDREEGLKILRAKL